MLHKGGISTHYATAGADLPSQAEKQPSSAVQLPITATLHAEYLTLFIRIIQHLTVIVNSNFFESQISILYYRKKCKSAHLHHTAETTHWRGNAPLAASRRTPHQSSIGSEEPMDDSFSPGRSLVPYPTRYLDTIHGANSHQRLLPRGRSCQNPALRNRVLTDVGDPAPLGRGIRCRRHRRYLLRKINFSCL